MRKSKKFTFFDVCAGIWAGHEALVRNGWECVGFSEINEKAEKTYRILHDAEKLKNFWNIMEVNARQLPDFDVLIWWFPCQTFSIIWQRKWMEDERGQIIYWIIKVLKEKNVKFCILENVKWLINHDKWNTYAKILELLDEAWYVVESKLLKSSDYWIPQIRERIYFVCIRKDLFLEKYSFPKKEKVMQNLSNFLIDTDENMVFNEMSKWWWTFEKYLQNKYNKSKISILDLEKQEWIIFDTRQSDLRIYQNLVPTLRTWRHGIFYVRNNKFRRLSWFESLLLQWFSEEKARKTKNISNTNLLSQAGNAFTVDVIEKIVKNLFLTKIKNEW